MEEKTVEELKQEIAELEKKYARLALDFKWIRDQNEELRNKLRLERLLNQTN